MVTNVTHQERVASVAIGSALIARGLRHRSWTSLYLTAVGGALVFRGATGHCPAYAAMNESTHPHARGLVSSNAVEVSESVTINRDASDLYERWRAIQDLPKLMPHLISVTPRDGGHSHWVAKGPGGQSVEWDAEIVEDLQNRRIAWQTIEGSSVESAGRVEFTPTGREGETRVDVRLHYTPPAGHAGAWIAWILGREPSQTIREDLRRFKAELEAGAPPTTSGQPRGRQSFLNYM